MWWISIKSEEIVIIILLLPTKIMIFMAEPQIFMWTEIDFIPCLRPVGGRLHWQVEDRIHRVIQLNLPCDRSDFSFCFCRLVTSSTFFNKKNHSILVNYLFLLLLPRVTAWKQYHIIFIRGILLSCVGIYRLSCGLIILVNIFAPLISDFIFKHDLTEGGI